MSARIAIIEDNPDNRMLLEALLSDRYQIDEYEDGVVGLEGVRVKPPDLVLLDISLPRMSGPEVLAQIRADPKLETLPVIALTAHAMAEDRDAFLAQGFDAYVAKPILDERELFTEIEKLLERPLQPSLPRLIA
ncbi:MAG: response regulator [Myxococcales bacterium]|nr:response regulator [Myxococcales bacterium]